LKEKGKVVRGWIGVTIQTVTPDLATSFGMKEAKGALVGDVVKGGPAEKGGIKTGDIIIAFDGKNVKTSNDLPRLVAETAVGKSVDITFIREGKELHATVKVEEMTEERTSLQSSAPMQSFGMKVDNITPQLRQHFGTAEKSGVIVMSVETGSLAAEAGIQPGDVIKEVNRKAVANMTDFIKSMEGSGKGKPVLMLLKRGKQTFFVSMERQ
jgi:serine protease Do